MNTLHLTAYAKVLLCTTALGLASIQDWKTREVSDLVWLVMGLCGAAITMVELALDFSLSSLVTLMMSAISCFLLGFGLYYLGFFGGADAKCLWCIGVTLPFNPLKNLAFSPVGPENPIFSISIFNNSILTAALLALGILVFNAIKRMRGPLFTGNEESSLWKRSLVLMLGYKVRVSKLLRKRDFYFLLEDLTLEGGLIKRRFRLSTRCVDDGSYERLKELVDKKIVEESEEIWASPAIPLIVNITAGFFIAMLHGDLVLAIAKAALSLTL
ncbi:MAG: A24 family peptidase C-terminal domain-containing protein [Candidatus Nezhaarchaeota archaeon]|nr:A24 family peptidase C-terminal domain-containing protein [Candidatus Nezhaarchaeota archaeon]